MSEPGFGARDKLQGGPGRGRCGDGIQYLLHAEQRILQSISARAPLANILNEICNALDSQIGNMVSLISTAEYDEISAEEIARNAALFGLHIFFAVGISAGSGELLGSLEMYCCTSRQPTAEEFQLIERAACLAELAVSRDQGASEAGSDETAVRSAKEYFPAKWPESMN